jgi:3-hydroxyisobutyrate dehydrogenase
MAKQRLGFVGLGLMGTAMSLRLLDKGWPLTVWNLEPERVSPVVSAGAVAAGSPAAVAKASDIVLMCVSHTKAVEECVFGAHGIARAGVSGKILIDHSTADPAWPLLPARPTGARRQVLCDERRGEQAHRSVWR